MKQSGNNLQAYLATCQLKKFAKGRTLLYQGEIPRCAYYVKSGSVKAYGINRTGEERIVTLHVADEVFPTPWLFSATNYSLFYYEALSDCAVYVVNKQSFMDFLPDNSPAAMEVLNYYASSAAGYTMRLNAIQQSGAHDMIIHTLYFLMKRYGREITPGRYVIQLELTHQLLASLIGLTRETVATRLYKLKKNGVISYKGKRYVINQKQLLKALGDDENMQIDLQ